MRCATATMRVEACQTNCHLFTVHRCNLHRGTAPVRSMCAERCMCVLYPAMHGMHVCTKTAFSDRPPGGLYP